jgi:outer membrane murein-binding lipoprotein Lpp
MRLTSVVLTVAVLTVVSLAGCQAAPRARPIGMGPVDTGADSVEAVRRQLQGSWALVSLDIYPAGAEKVTAQASGRLTYDEHGNLTMTGTIAEGPQLDPSALNFSGRATIDPVTHTLRLMAIRAASTDAKRVDPKLDASHVRYYQFAGDLLTTTIKDAKGVTTASATWKRTE